MQSGEGKSEYPFAGYRDVLGEIGRRVLEKNHSAVLDVGFGTGALTGRLYRAGCRITGVDFSERMIRIAREKMERADFFQYDFRTGLPAAVMHRRFDFIVSTYALHHLNDPARNAFLRSLRPMLNPGGKILIGDVAFPTRASLSECERESGDKWDRDETYFVFDELARVLCKTYSCSWRRLSFCAGVIALIPRETEDSAFR